MRIRILIRGELNSTTFHSTHPSPKNLFLFPSEHSSKACGKIRLVSQFKWAKRLSPGLFVVIRTCESLALVTSLPKLKLMIFRFLDYFLSKLSLGTSVAAVRDFETFFSFFDILSDMDVLTEHKPKQLSDSPKFSNLLLNSSHVNSTSRTIFVLET